MCNVPTSSGLQSCSFWDLCCWVCYFRKPNPNSLSKLSTSINVCFFTGGCGLNIIQITAKEVENQTFSGSKVCYNLTAKIPCHFKKCSWIFHHNSKETTFVKPSNSRCLKNITDSSKDSGYWEACKDVQPAAVPLSCDGFMFVWESTCTWTLDRK